MNKLIDNNQIENFLLEFQKRLTELSNSLEHDDVIIFKKNQKKLELLKNDIERIIDTFNSLYQAMEEL